MQKDFGDSSLKEFAGEKQTGTSAEADCQLECCTQSDLTCVPLAGDGGYAQWSETQDHDIGRLDESRNCLTGPELHLAGGARSNDGGDPLVAN